MCVLVNHLQQQPSLHEPVLEAPSHLKHDPIQAFVQQLLGQSKAAVSKPTPMPTPIPSPMPSSNNSKPELDPIQSLIQQAQWNAAQNGGVANHVDAQVNHVAPGFHGIPPGPALVPWPPQTMPIGLPIYPSSTEAPTSVWDLENAKAEETKRMMEQQQQQQQQQKQLKT